MKFPARRMKCLDLFKCVLLSALLAVTIWNNQVSAEPTIIETDRYIVYIENEMARLYGKWPSGNIFTGEFLEVALTRFQEVSVDTIDMSAPETVSYWTSGATASFVTEKLVDVARGSPAVNATVVTQTLFVPAGSVSTQFSVYEAPTTLSYGPLNVSVVPDSIKLGFFSSNWTFAPTSAAWRFWLNFTIYTPDVFQIQRYEYYDTSRQATAFFVGTPALNITLYFQTRNVLDGEVRIQRFTGYQYEVGEFGGGLGVRFSQAWQYSRFNSVIYDPDFSILVTIDEPPRPPPLGVSPNGTPQSQLPQSPLSVSDALIQASFPIWIPIIIVLLVLLAAAAVAAVLYFRQRRRSAEAKARLNSLVSTSAHQPDATPDSKQTPSQGTRNTRWTMADASRATLKESATK